MNGAGRRGANASALPAPPPSRRTGHSSLRGHPLFVYAVAAASFAVLSVSSYSKITSSLAQQQQQQQPVEKKVEFGVTSSVNATARLRVSEWNESLFWQNKQERGGDNISEPAPRATRTTSSSQASEGEAATTITDGTSVSRADEPRLYHMCTCLTDNNPQNANVPPTPNRLRWLHIPKTGTSFISTLWSHASSNDERYIDLNINSHFCSNYDDASYSMYDFSLMRRYPWEIYGAPNMIPKNVTLSAKDVGLVLVGGTQHTPLGHDAKDGHYVSSEHYKRVRHKLRRHGSEVAGNITVAAFFRQPEERIVSAYYDGRHASGFPAELWTKMKAASFGGSSPKQHSCEIDGRTYHNPLECFGRYPGIAGCMSRMLTGETCADGVLQESGVENLPYATRFIADRLDFAGITEDWNESVCQFHRLFTGKVDAVTGKRHWNAPLQGEFSNVHKSNRKKVFDVQHLNGFRDVADGVVYEAAKLKFERMVGENRCYRYMTADEVKAEKLANDGVPIPSNIDDLGNVCNPKTCLDLGKQCGEWDDGCGKTIICGLCNPGRTGLPSTWRVRCVKGQCVDYCPPWDEKGYWFLSDDSPPLIKDFFRGERARQTNWISPVEAVEICEVACGMNNPHRQDGIEMFVDNGLCQCGNTAKMLSANLTQHDFTSAHSLMAMCKDEKARQKAVLLETDTQPICCPYIEQNPKQYPMGWKKSYSIGGGNLEGDYFDHIPLDCGGFEKCESIARQGGAELAVFDLFNNMCYLARNVVHFDDAFTVTKDNQSRYMIDLRMDAVLK